MHVENTIYDNGRYGIISDCIIYIGLYIGSKAFYDHEERKCMGKGTSSITTHFPSH